MSKSTVFYLSLSPGIKESFNRDVHTLSKSPLLVDYRYARKRLYNYRLLKNGLSSTSAVNHHLHDYVILHTREHEGGADLDVQLMV